LRDPDKALSPKLRLSRRPDILQCDLTDGGVLYDREREMTYTLNITAFLFWSYLEGDLSLEEIAAEVSSVSKANEDNVMKDLCSAVAFFRDNNLLVQSADSA
jgi:hypothetical protein